MTRSFNYDDIKVGLKNRAKQGVEDRTYLYSDLEIDYARLDRIATADWIFIVYSSGTQLVPVTSISTNETVKAVLEFYLDRDDSKFYGVTVNLNGSGSIRKLTKEEVSQEIETQMRAA